MNVEQKEVKNDRTDAGTDTKRLTVGIIADKRHAEPEKRYGKLIDKQLDRCIGILFKKFFQSTSSLLL
jgi:hypothetical protein